MVPLCAPVKDFEHQPNLASPSLFLCLTTHTTQVQDEYDKYCKQAWSKELLNFICAITWKQHGNSQLTKRKCMSYLRLWEFEAFCVDICDELYWNLIR